MTIKSELKQIKATASKALDSLYDKLHKAKYDSYRLRLNKVVRRDYATNIMNELIALSTIKPEIVSTEPINEIVSSKKPKTIKAVKKRITKTQIEKVVKILKSDRLNMNEIVSTKNPIFEKSSVVQKFNKFERQAFTYKNSKTLEDLYLAIKDAQNRFPQATFASIHFKEIGDEGDNKIRTISIQASDLYSYEFFLEKYDSIVDGTFKKQNGQDSDAINRDETVPIFTNFSLGSLKFGGYGKSDKMLYEVEGIEESTRVVKGKNVGNKDCALQCLKKIYHDQSWDSKKLEFLKNDSLSDIYALTNFIRTSELPIEIYANGFELTDCPKNLIEKSGVEIIHTTNKHGVKTRHIATQLKPEHVGTIAGGLYFETTKCLYSPNIEKTLNDPLIKIKAKIIFDDINSHYDVLKNNEIKLNDGLHLTIDGKILKGNDIIFSTSEVNKNNKTYERVEHKFVFFDYETVIDFDKSNCMQEYSLSILYLTNNRLEELALTEEPSDSEKRLDWMRRNNPVDQVALQSLWDKGIYPEGKDVPRRSDFKPMTLGMIRKRYSVTFTGYDCTTKFIEWIREHEVDCVFTFIGFNNSNFDNFFLLDGLLSYEHIDYEADISSIFYNGSQLLNFKMSGRHDTFDIRRHLTGSLKANCESFKIKCCAKKSFDHNVSQQKYLNGELIEFITDNKELKDYNEFDVLATAVLFYKYRDALSEIEVMKPIAKELHTYKTIGSMIFTVFEEKTKEQKCKLPKLTFEQYKDLQKYKIAGRVEMFNGVKKVKLRIVSTDVCSLYPYVMSICDVHYPCGEIVQTETFMGFDKIGFYYCDIDQSNLKEMNLPKIYAKKCVNENDWSNEDILDDYLISTVTIGLLLKYSCKVIIKKGFYFTNKIKSCDLFGFLLEIMKVKNSQDDLKAKKDPKYNPALRDTTKLLMNAPSGKVIEGLHCEKTVAVSNISEYAKIKEKSEAINFINCIGKKMFFTYTVNEEKIIKKQRPIYIGIMIYDYAKRHMYINSYSKIGLDHLLYTDTDATKFSHDKFIEWKKDIDDNNLMVPHWPEIEKIDPRYKTHKLYDANSKVFGSFEDELEDMVGDNYTFYCLEKKSWCYDVDGISKFRFKGLNGRAINVDLNLPFIEKKKIRHVKTVKKEAWVEEKYFLKKGSDLEVYNYVENNKHLSIEMSGALNFFEKLYVDRSAYVLCCSFRKIVKNMCRNVEHSQTDKHNKIMNSIQENYMLKKITLKND